LQRLFNNELEYREAYECDFHNIMKEGRGAPYVKIPVLFRMDKEER